MSKGRPSGNSPLAAERPTVFYISILHLKVLRGEQHTLGPQDLLQLAHRKVAPVRDEVDAYRVHLDTGARQAPEVPQPMPEGPRTVRDTPFCLGILGDFSGRSTAGAPADTVDLGARRLIRVTPENVLGFAGLTPCLKTGGFGATEEPEEIRFVSFDSFHPTRLFEDVAGFEALREARRRILTDQVQSPEDVPAEFEPGPSDSGHPELNGDGVPPKGGLLDAVLDETRTEAPEAGASALDEDLDAFIRRAVQPHVIPSDAERTRELEAFDHRVSEYLDRLIHRPSFQAIESLWRSVVFLLSQVEVSSKLRIYLIDVSRTELEADLLRTDDPGEWSLAGLFLNPISEHGEELRWGGLIGAYHFGGGSLDVPLLQRIGFLAEAAEVPWLSGGDPLLFGCRSLIQAPEPRDWREPLDPLWTQLRGNPEARWISLSLPDFLVRSPYRASGRKKGGFVHAEAVGGHADLLWGNAAFLSGIGLARAFARSGWDLHPGGAFSVENVPVHHPPEGSAGPLQASLSHEAAAQVGEAGLTPALAPRNESVIRISGIRSISDQDRPLGAWWRMDP